MHPAPRDFILFSTVSIDSLFHFSNARKESLISRSFLFTAIMSNVQIEKAQVYIGWLEKGFPYTGGKRTKMKTK